MKKLIFGVFLLLLTGGSLFIWLGVYNIAATEKHWAVTNLLLEIVRERSIEARAGNIIVPDLDDPNRIASAAMNYDEMCSMCHLAPGIETSEWNEGLYPQPPVFNKKGEDHNDHEKRESFWVIKNGIKLTGMPAWGGSHNDKEIWGLVAFISKLKDMSASEYKSLTTDKNTQNDLHADNQQETH